MALSSRQHDFNKIGLLIVAIQQQRSSQILFSFYPFIVSFTLKDKEYEQILIKKFWNGLLALCITHINWMGDISSIQLIIWAQRRVAWLSYKPYFHIFTSLGSQGRITAPGHSAFLVVSQAYIKA